jgi:nucleoid DNA-binding protein
MYINHSKKNIIKNVSFGSDISYSEAASMVESFLLLIKTKSKSKTVKITSFGSFCFKKTPKRLGRNPKTKDSYIIPELNKLTFKPSNKIKERIN